MSFAISSMTFGAAADAPVQKAFDTKRTGVDRLSKPVKMLACHYNQTNKSIQVFCEDGFTRECRVERLPSAEVGRELWKKLRDLGQAGKPVQFIAAGGFSPDRWFYDVKE